MNKYKGDITHIIENDTKKIDTRYGDTEVCIKEESFNLLAQEIITYFMPIISNLEAKVYAYEKIIANSNFKSVLEETKSNTNKDIEALKEGKDIKEIPQFQGTLEALDKLKR